ncbi:MAG: TetR/AcrR family transcriptional regulator [Cyclobacteriaceae bacterium]|nr:TetR/AcrR family transcriptional regulator [Cyclobacteriaceae bacterium]MCK5467364.1 TetR/AcrR family transcriptional regulator [Cyclobacteriaceae bacterium]MCK5701878.1 TetR/AcrR family transcriptional regulator [Cyclobacteriaceae bacterium]
MGNTLKTSSTEEKILEAAKKVFIRKGMYGARMQEIADEAGINKALLHYYFRSKNKLFEAIFKDAFQEMAPKAFDILKGDLPFDEKIKLFVANYIDTISANPFLPLFIINEINQNPGRLGPIVNLMGVIKEEISKDIKVKIDSGEFRDIDPVQLFLNIIAMALFPFLTKPIIQGAFSFTDEMFQEFLEERKKLIPDIILNYLKIKN